MSAWTIRDARADDAETIVALVHRLNLDEGNPPGRMTADDFRCSGFGAQRRFRTLLAEAEGRVLGYALFYPSYDTDFGAAGFYLQDLYVVQEARRCGIGRALMAAVARACRAEGGCYLFWNALERNQAGRAFYRRIGPRGAGGDCQPTARRPAAPRRAGLRSRARTCMGLRLASRAQS